MENTVKPIELCIESEEVIKRYRVTDAMEIVRCRTSIFLHSTCFWVVSKPTLANNLQGGALFEMLKWYCDYQDERDTYSEEDKEKNDTICALIVNILTLPLDIFTDMNFFVDVSDFILKRRNEYYDSVWKEAETEKPETLEDAMKNIEYEAAVAIEEQLGEEISEIAKKKEANATDKRPSKRDN